MSKATKRTVEAAAGAVVAMGLTSVGGRVLLGVQAVPLLTPMVGAALACGLFRWLGKD